MEPTDGSPPNSMYMVRCGELFPKPPMEKEDDKLAIPLKELPGEGVKFIGETRDGVLALTNYRIFVLQRQQEKSVPLGLIDTVQSRDLLHLIVNCKDANTVKCSFETTEKCSEWQRRITVAVSSLVNLNSLFAFPFYAWLSEYQRAMSSPSRSSSPTANNNGNNHQHHSNNGTLATIANEAEWTGRLRKISSQDYDEEFRKEVERLQFNLRGAWRISKINEDFKFCPSYPRHFLVPIYITDETLQSVASFRSSRRIPVAVWRHRTTGAIIARCSQPEVGWLGWRNNKDEELLQAFVNACAFDQKEQQQQQPGDYIPGGGDGGALAEWGKEYGKANGDVNGQLNGGEQAGRTGFDGGGGGGVGGGSILITTSDAESVCSSSSPEGSHEEMIFNAPKKMQIVDARSYASAVTNRARGGGCECIDYYPSAEIQFMNLANIHAIRKSFNALRQLCASPPDMGSWLSNLEKTLWLQHLSGLLAASVFVTRTIEVEGRPVLVHCSDGWDRTPQIVATAQLCLDPYYRTVNGFKTLVEREWLSFGHKFGDRCGHGPNSYELNERCPVFLQWLDCVHQIHNQFPCSFEFSIGYLIKLAQHSHSGLFGTFLTNTMRERIENSIFDTTYSVWPFLSGPMYKNPLYVPNRATVLWPAYNIRDLTLWNEVYLGNLHINQAAAGAAATTINAEALGTKMETTLLERMESVEDGDDKLDNVIGALNLDVEDEQIEALKHANGTSEPVSPMSKTRSYGDLLEANGTSTGPHRRCSDPTVPIELLLKQNGLQQQQHNGGLASMVKREINLCDNGESVILPNESDVVIRASKELVEKMNGFNMDEYSASPLDDAAATTTTTTIASPNNQIESNASGGGGEEQSVTNGQMTVSHVSPLLDLINASDDDDNDCGGGGLGRVALDDHRSAVDSVDGSPPPPQLHSLNLLSSSIALPTTAVNYDVMLESVDLRARSEDDSMDNNFTDLVELEQQPQQQQKSSTGNGSLWHGNVETSTDTLVPMNANALTEEESKHFPGSSSSCNGDLSNFLTKHDENEEMRLQRGEGGGDQIANGIDCSVYGERSSFNLGLLNDQSLYMDLTAATTTTPVVATAVLAEDNNKINMMDMSLIESVIQSQPQLSSKRHRRTPSNSKSEPSPHKFQNGNMSPSATMNSRFSTPGGRSPLTPPDGNVPVFEKANNVILSCPDGLAHALSEQNIRLQQIIYEHKLREEALQRELNATRLALLKRICYQCNNNHNQAPSSNNEEQNTNTDAGENISVCSWEAVEERGGGSGTSTTSVQSDTVAPSKVLWVPDHAVNKCTGCSFEFWLGRRKHHCRSCGKIFCSECSEFFAPLPEERLYNPVRLCGPCYVSVTTKLQSQQQMQQSQQEYQNQQPFNQQHQQSASHQVNHNNNINNYNVIVNQNYCPPMKAAPPSSGSCSKSPSPQPMTHKRVSSLSLLSNGGGGESDRDKTMMGRSVIAASQQQQRKESAPPILHNSGSCCREVVNGGGGRMCTSMTTTTTTSSTGQRHLIGTDSVNSPLMRSVSEGSSKSAVVANGNGPTTTTNSLDGCCNLKTATASN